jgi:hypothetical protein
MLPDFETGPTGTASSGATRRERTFAELLIGCEEDRTLRAVGRDAAAGCTLSEGICGGPTSR